MFKLIKNIFSNIAKNGIKKTNGKKTVSGLALVAVGVSIKFISPLQDLGFMSNELIYTGLSLAGIGATHKIIKKKKKEA